jgi:hypothetical protein
LFDIGDLSDHDRCCSLANGVFGEFDGGALAIVGDHDVIGDGKILFGAGIFMIR